MAGWEHMSVKGMQTLARFGYLPLYKFADLSTCDHCIYGRQTQGPHSKHLSLKSSPMDLLHTDVCEMPQLSLGGARYMVTFIDDATRKVWAYPLRLKSEVFGIFQRFLAMVENQTNKKLKCLRSDNGGEYMSNAFQEFCDSKGIKRELPPLYNPPQNGVAERMNRTIQEKV